MSDLGPGVGDLSGTAFENRAITGSPSGYIDPVEQRFAAHQPAPSPSPAPAAPIDPFAGLTKTQVMTVQRDLGFTGRDVDGIAGPKTRAAYAAKYGNVPATSTPPLAPPTPTGAPLGPTGGSSAPAASTGSTAAPTPAAAPTASIEDQIRQKYGYLGTILLDNPEIHNVLVQAVQGGWQPAQVEGALMGTAYWKTTQSSVRNWQTLQGTDPASAQAQIGTMQAQIGTQAEKLGVQIGPDRLRQMAEDSLKFGWDSNQLSQAIASEFHYVPGGQQGGIGQAEVQIRQLAKDYLVPLSDSTLSAWDGQIARGTATPETFRQYLLSQAKSMFPALSQQLDAGMTTTQLAEPYRQIAAKDLDLSPDAIDFTDPKWSRALTQIDPKTNAPTTMSLYDWQRTIRGDDVYGFKDSHTGKTLAADATVGLLQGLGKLAA